MLYKFSVYKNNIILTDKGFVKAYELTRQHKIFTDLDRFLIKNFDASTHDCFDLVSKDGSTFTLTKKDSIECKCNGYKEIRSGEISNTSAVELSEMRDFQIERFKLFKPNVINTFVTHDLTLEEFYEFGSLCLLRKNSYLSCKSMIVQQLLKNYFAKDSSFLEIPSDLIYGSSIEQKRHFLSGMIDHFGLIYKHSNTWDISIIKYPIVREQINILSSMLGFICKQRYAKKSTGRLYISGNFFDLPLQKKTCTDVRQQRNSFGFNVEKTDKVQCIDIFIESDIELSELSVFTVNCFKYQTKLEKI